MTLQGLGKTHKTLLALLLASSTMLGTANAERYSPGIDGRLEALEDKIERLDRQKVNESPTTLSELRVEISQMREELRAIRGGIEENRFAVEQVQREMKALSEDTDYRLRELESGAGGAVADPFGEGGGATGEQAAPTPPAASTPEAANVPSPVMPPVQPQVQNQSPAAQILTPPPVMSTQPGMQIEVQPPAGQQVGVQPQVPATQGGAEMNFTDPREHYNFAVSLIKEKRYDRARDSFNRFVATHKDHRLASNAYYWLGETYYVESNFTQAADTFRQGFENNPNGIKAPDNLYKLAKSLIHLNKKNEACIVLEQIQRRYKQRNPEVVGLAFETQKANNCQ